MNTNGMPSKRLADHRDYIAAREMAERARASVREVERRYHEEMQGEASRMRDGHQAHEEQVAQAFLDGDYDAALRPPPSRPSTQTAQLLKAARIAERVARRRLEETRKSIARHVSLAHRGEFAKRVGVVEQKLRELMAAVGDADALSDELKRGGTHCPATLPLVRLEFFRHATTNPRTGARWPTPVDISLTQIKKFYGRNDGRQAGRRRGG